MHEEYWFPSSWYLFGANVSFHFTVNATEWIRMYNFGMQSGRWQIDSLIKIRLHFSIWVKIIFDSCRALVTNKYLLLTLKPFDDWIKLCNCNMLDKMVASDSMFNVHCYLHSKTFERIMHLWCMARVEASDLMLFRLDDDIIIHCLLCNSASRLSIHLSISLCTGIICRASFKWHSVDEETWKINSNGLYYLSDNFVLQHEEQKISDLLCDACDCVQFDIVLRFSGKLSFRTLFTAPNSQCI